MLQRSSLIRSSRAGGFRLDTSVGRSVMAVLSTMGFATVVGAQPTPKSPVQTAGYARYAAPNGGTFDPVCTRTSSALDAFVQHDCALLVSRRGVTRAQTGQSSALSIDDGSAGASRFVGDGSVSSWLAGRESQGGGAGFGQPGLAGMPSSNAQFALYDEAALNATTTAVRVSTSVPRGRQGESSDSNADTTSEAGAAAAPITTPRLNTLQADNPDLTADLNSAAQSGSPSQAAQNVLAPATSINQGIDFDQPGSVTSLGGAPATFGAPGFTGTEEMVGAQLFDAPTVGASLDLSFQAAPAAVVLPDAVEIVPEPASLALVGAGLVMLAAFRARRKADQL